MKDVFISYSTRDQGAKDELVALFEREGISYFLDENDLKIGESLNESLEQALRDSRFTVLLVSENSLLSVWVYKEILFRLMQAEFHKSNVLLPVLLDNTVFEAPGFEFKVHDCLSEQLIVQKSLRSEAEARKMNTGKYNTLIERLEKILPNIPDVFHKLTEGLSAVFYEPARKEKDLEKLLHTIKQHQENKQSYTFNPKSPTPMNLSEIAYSGLLAVFGSPLAGELLKGIATNATYDALKKVGEKILARFKGKPDKVQIDSLKLALIENDKESFKTQSETVLNLLKEAFEADEVFRKEVEQILGGLDESGLKDLQTQTSVVVQNSQNVITGGEFKNISGGFRIGDNYGTP